MTIALGVNFGNYALVAADTRTTQYNLDGSVCTYIDDSEKIQKTKCGLITGAGSVQLLDIVKGRLKEEEVTNTNQIISMIKEARISYKRKFWLTAARDIELTGWIFTYTTLVENKPKLRLGIMHPLIGDEIGLYEDNNPALICPVEATKEEADIISDFLLKAIKHSKDFSTLSESIQYHWSVIAKLTREIQPKYPSMSPYSQIGIHTIDGLIGISPILKDDKSNITIKLERSS